MQTAAATSVTAAAPLGAQAAGGDNMNKKPLFATLTTVLLICCLALPSEFTKASGGNLSTDNSLLNGGFENGDYLPTSWLPDSWASGAAFIWDNTQAYQGNRSIKISLATPNDARWVQGVTVQPNTDYRLSGWIKTENVAHTSEAVASVTHLGQALVEFRAAIREAVPAQLGQWASD